MSVEPVSEIAGPASRVGSDAMVLLRLSSAEAFVRGLHLLATEQREIAASHYKRGDHGNANACGVIADCYDHVNENFRRLLACSELRQPQENIKDEPRPL